MNIWVTLSFWGSILLLWLSRERTGSICLSHIYRGRRLTYEKRANLSPLLTCKAAWFDIHVASWGDVTGRRELQWKIVFNFSTHELKIACPNKGFYTPSTIIGIIVAIATNLFSKTHQCNYDKSGQGYMFRPRFEATFRPFVVEQLINSASGTTPLDQRTYIRHPTRHVI
jgi:hypothetical protein